MSFTTVPFGITLATLASILCTAILHVFGATSERSARPLGRFIQTDIIVRSTGLGASFGGCEKSSIYLESLQGLVKNENFPRPQNGTSRLIACRGKCLSLFQRDQRCSLHVAVGQAGRGMRRPALFILSTDAVANRPERLNQGSVSSR